MPFFDERCRSSGNTVEVRNKLLKIMNMILENGEVLNDFRKTVIKPLYKNGDKSEYCNY